MLLSKRKVEISGLEEQFRGSTDQQSEYLVGALKNEEKKESHDMISKQQY